MSAFGIPMSESETSSTVSEDDPSDAEKPVTVLLIGDRGCGKTAFARANFNGPEDSAKYSGYFPFFTKEVLIEVWDPPAEELLTSFRSLRNNAPSVVFFCFGIDSPDSLDSIKREWIPELEKLDYHQPCIVVGLKKDLRDSYATIARLADRGQAPVSDIEGDAVADHALVFGYVECSAKLQEAFEEVFRAALLSTHRFEVDTKSG